MREKIRQALSSYRKKSISDKKLTEAAVLIPIFCKAGEYHILFIQRSNHVAYHKGQAAFPGGTRSEVDSSLLDTALRESWEEVGLETGDVEILGELDDLTTITGFIISPFAAFIPYPYDFKKNHCEIDEIFDLPLSALMEKTTLRQEQQVIDGEINTVYFYEYGGRVVWGATARIVKQLVEILQSASGAQL